MRRLDSWLRPEGAAAAFFAIATVFLLQSTRAFVSYLVFVVDQSQRVTIAAVALLAFAFPISAWLLARLTTPQRLATASLLCLIFARLGLQVIEQPVFRIAAGGSALAAWGLLAVLTVTAQRRSAAVGLVLGFGLDLALRTARGALDLPWMPGFRETATTLLLSVLLTYLWWRGRHDVPATGAGWRSAGALLVIGPALALFHLVTGNIAFVSTRSDLSASGASTVLAVGLVVGVLIALLRLLAINMGAGGGPLVGRFILFDAIIGAVALSFAWSGSGLAMLGAFFVTVTITELVLFALAATDGSGAMRLGPAATLTTVGLLLQFIVLFIYYTSTGSGAMLAVAWLGLVVGTLVAAVSLTAGLQSGPLDARAYATPAAAVALLLAGSIAWSYGHQAHPLARPGEAAEVRLITYNIQSGFARDNYWDLEAIARVIEASEADIVFLQEVDRGWLVSSGNDQLAWLSRRLEMPYAWGPASSDDLWGNAILSRYPLLSERVVKYDSTENLSRSALIVELDLGAGRTVAAVATHLDNPDEASQSRSAQVNQLLGLLPGSQPTILAGDFNMSPEDALIHAIVDSGLVDAGLAAGATGATSDDGRRIDYIFVRPDIVVLDAAVIDSAASDHRPVAATVALP